MRFLLPLITLLITCTATAQPTWRFHLAFEDGTGARDTIWLMYDITATTGSNSLPQVDYALGEGGVQIDHSQFNVFTGNWDGDSTKTHAYPYTAFPNFDGNIIDAINWTPPMTIRWDTSLFHAPYLPYNQGHFGIAIMDGIAFSQFDHDMGFGVFNMLAYDSVTIDLLADFLFPIPVYFGPVDFTGVPEESTPTKLLSIWPNPAQETLRIELSGEQAKGGHISDLSGRRVAQWENAPIDGLLDVSSLHPGIYLITVYTNQNHICHGTFEKIP